MPAKAITGMARSHTIEYALYSLISLQNTVKIQPIDGEQVLNDQCVRATAKWLSSTSASR